LPLKQKKKEEKGDFKTKEDFASQTEDHAKEEKGYFKEKDDYVSPKSRKPCV
jgi:hypothetical protein